MTKTVDQLYQVIADAMVDSLPKKWVSAWIDARLIDDFGEAKLYYQEKPGKTLRAELGIDAFDSLDQALQELRALMKQPDRPAWTTAKVSLERSGKFHIDFGYDDAPMSVQ